MLVYHFKGRIVVLEHKCDTMFDIMNGLIKEMKNIQYKVAASAIAAPQFGGPDIISVLDGKRFPQQSQPVEYIYEDERRDHADESDEGSTDDESSDDEGSDTQSTTGEDKQTDEQLYKRIVVSDAEDNEDEDEDTIKIIHVEIGHPEIGVYEPVEINDTEADAEVDVEVDAEADAEADVEVDAEVDVDADAGVEIKHDSLEKTLDYKKMDISYLRTLVITRGLATDTKKLKKADLVKLLSDE